MQKYINMFTNIEVGPFLLIPKIEAVQDVIQEVLEKGFITTSVVTDKNDVLFTMFKQGPEEEPAVAICTTIRYIKNYD